MNEFSIRTRAGNLASMSEEPLDVLVVGGGIVGAWTALTATRRGYRTGLVERGDFSSGTSGKTSRLIHGGLRYLQQFRIGVVKRAARERDVLLRMAGSLVKPVRFLIPVYRGRGPKGWQLRLGLWLYDALSKEKVLPKRKWLTQDEALRLEPALGNGDLQGAALYYDAYANDARLVLRVVRAASEAGALVANYAPVVEFMRESGQVTGARVVNLETGRACEIQARAIVNATGVWAETLAGNRSPIRLRPTKGIHLFVPRDRIGHRNAVALPTRDGRTVFVLPWGQFSLVGTTDTAFGGSFDRVEADRADVDYLLDALNDGFLAAGLTHDDVVGTYAGLRPLVDTGEAWESDISRKHAIVEGSDGLITGIGGKLTTGRAMAAELMERVERRLGVRGHFDTAHLNLDWPVAARHTAPRFAPRSTAADIRRIGVDGEVASRLAEIQAGPFAREAGWNRMELASRLLPGLPVCGLEVLFAARHEMAVHLDDVIIRRSGLFYLLSDRALGVAPQVAAIVGEELGWDPSRRQAELDRLRELAAQADRWREEVHV